MASTSTIRSLLMQLEQHIGGIPAARADIDAVMGTPFSYPREAAIRNLAVSTRQKVAELRGQIAAAFDAAKAEAQQMRNDAARQFGQSTDGARYLSALAGYGAIASRMSADQLAERLNGAVAAGLVGETRAWRELAQLYTPRTLATGQPEDTVTLRMALLASEDAAKSRLELAADAEASYLADAERRYRLWAGQVNSRIDRTLDGQKDYHPGSLSPQNILDGQLAAVEGVTTDGGEAND